MSETTPRIRALIGALNRDEDAYGELVALGVIDDAGRVAAPPAPPARPRVDPAPIVAPSVLNEAYDYDKPSSFARGLSLTIGPCRLLTISGTASIDEQGQTLYVGDFSAQCWRTFRNIATLLAAEGATWHDVIRTTCYLRDIERDYDTFNRIRTSFYGWMGLDPLPASVGIQMRLCRDDLLVEIESMALVPA